VSGAEEILRSKWRAELTRALETLAKTEIDIRNDRKSALWKVAIAFHMKRTTQATNGWLAEALRMGGGVAVSQYVGFFGKSAHHVELAERLKT
jgi:putative transposase